jgi:hypothetical protein
MKTFIHDHRPHTGRVIGFQAETKEEKEFLEEFMRQPASNLFVTGCSDPEGGNAVALSIRIVNDTPKATQPNEETK